MTVFRDAGSYALPRPPSEIFRTDDDILTDSPLDAGAGPLPGISGSKGIFAAADSLCGLSAFMRRVFSARAMAVNFF